jgi:hypothetical protein
LFAKPQRDTRVHCEVGREVISNITVQSQGVGSVVLSPPLTLLNPSVLPGARLSRIASLYERWRVKSIKFEFIPDQGLDTAGQLLGAFIENPLSVTATGNSLVQVLQAHDSADLCPAIRRKMWVYKPKVFKDVKEWYYCNVNAVQDPLLTYCGAFWLVDPSGSLVEDTVYGMMILHYEIEFAVACADPPTSGSGFAGEYLVEPDVDNNLLVPDVAVSGLQNGTFTPQITTTFVPGDTWTIPAGTYRTGVDIVTGAGDSGTTVLSEIFPTDGEQVDDFATNASSLGAYNSVNIGEEAIGTLTGWISDIGAAVSTIVGGVDTALNFVYGLTTGGDSCSINAVVDFVVDVIGDLITFAYTTGRSYRIYSGGRVVCQIGRGRAAWAPYAELVTRYSKSWKPRMSKALRRSFRATMVEAHTALHGTVITKTIRLHRADVSGSSTSLVNRLLAVKRASDIEAAESKAHVESDDVGDDSKTAAATATKLSAAITSLTSVDTLDKMLNPKGFQASCGDDGVLVLRSTSSSTDTAPLVATKAKERPTSAPRSRAAPRVAPATGGDATTAAAVVKTG